MFWLPLNNWTKSIKPNSFANEWFNATISNCFFFLWKTEPKKGKKNLLLFQNKKATHCRLPIHFYFGSTSYWHDECAACVFRNKYAFISWHVNFYQWQLLFATSFFCRCWFFFLRRLECTQPNTKEKTNQQMRNKYRKKTKIANEWWNTYA